MKPFRILFIALLALITGQTVVAQNVGTLFYSTNSGTELRYRITSTSPRTVEVCSCSSSQSGSVTIPSSVYYSGYYYDVTNIYNWAFSNCENITSVSIPSSVKDIGYYAFNSCDALATVTFNGSNLKTIGYDAFNYCQKLTSVSLPSSVTSIGGYAFYHCDALTTVTFNGSNLKTIGNYAFYYCKKLTSVSLPSSVTTIGNSTFSNCEALATVTGYSNAEYVGSSAFYGTPWYNALPNGPVYIGKALYVYKGYNMPEGTTYAVKDGTKSITTGAFNSLAGLQGVTIPASVDTIGRFPFYSCRNLTSISVATGNARYDSRNGCNAIIEKSTNKLISGCNSTLIPSTVKIIASYAFRGSNIESVNIPDAVDSIGGYAFENCYKLKKVTIGKGLRAMNIGIFFGCRALESLTVSAANPYFDSRNNCNAIIEKSANTLREGCPTTTIPSSVKAIGAHAFNNRSTLYSFTIPNHIESIGNYAFYNNSSMKSITIGSGVKTIGNYAFNNSSIRNVHSLIDFPSEISENTFHQDVYEQATLYVPVGSRANYQGTPGWNKFQHIVETNNNGSYDGDVFEVRAADNSLLYYQVLSAQAKTCELIGASVNVTGKVTIPSTVNGHTVTSVGYQAFYDYNYNRGITEVVLPNTLTNIGNSAFYYCKELKSINLPEGLTNIGNHAFYNCGKLENITLPSSLKIIGSWAFGYATINSIVIPKNVTSIGSGCFGACDNLKSIAVENGNVIYDSRNNCNAIVEKATKKLVSGCQSSTIPNGVERIGNSAFNSHTQLTSITIPNTVTTIDTLAFNNTGLTSIVIPSSVRDIKDGAFQYCDNLKSITVKAETPYTIDDNVFTSRSTADDCYATATLYVPVGTKSKYKNTAGWNKFQNILEQEAELVRGDVNGDRQVNGTDLVALGNIILGKSSQTAGADVNGDSRVNGTDYVALVNIIMGQSNARQRETSNNAQAEVYVEPFNISGGETASMLIALRNPEAAVTLMQMDVELPEGLSVRQLADGMDIGMAGRTSFATHQLSGNKTCDGNLRLLLFSMSNAPIGGTDGAVIRLTLEAAPDFKGGTIRLHDILNVTPDVQELTATDVLYQIGSGTNGIDTLTDNATSTQPFYTTSGQRLSAPHKGINIVGGKKVIMK